MAEPINQRFAAIADDEQGEFSVYPIYNEQLAIDAIKQQQKERKIIYMFFDAVDMNAAIRYAEGIYPHYHCVQNVLAPE